MISFDVNVTGPQIARALANDEEEFAYGLKELAEEFKAARIGSEVSAYIGDDDAATVVAWLRELADTIEAAP